LLINELEIIPSKLVPVLNYNGDPLSAEMVRREVEAHLQITLA